MLKMIKLFHIRLWEFTNIYIYIYIYPSSYLQNWHSLLSILKPTYILLCIYAHKNTQSNTYNLMQSYIFLIGRKRLKSWDQKFYWVLIRVLWDFLVPWMWCFIFQIRLFFFFPKKIWVIIVLLAISKCWKCILPCYIDLQLEYNTIL